jgi:hypothetical protein
MYDFEDATWIFAIISINNNPFLLVITKKPPISLVIKSIYGVISYMTRILTVSLNDIRG